MARTFHDRHFPVRPNLDQLKHQAKDLLRAIRQVIPPQSQRSASIIPENPPKESSPQLPSLPMRRRRWREATALRAGPGSSRPAA